MKIYRDGEILHDLTIDENTTILRRLMVENSLNLRVAVARSSALGLKIGDYTNVGSERYVIMDEPSDTLRAGVYDHTILMRGALHRLEVYMMPDEGRDEWWYFGSPIDHINRVMSALHTKEAGWTVQLPDLTKFPDTSPKNINYANMSILSAFHAICSTESGWGLEFDVLPGQVIRFDRQIKNPTAHTFEYGRGKGLYEMTRGTLSGEKIATRIIGYGGTANMLNGARLSFAPINGGFSYIDKNVDLYGLREERVNFDHIYPRRNGSITSDAAQVEAGKANWTVADSTLDFDLNQQLVEGAVIMFSTGECVAVEFEIVAYDHATKTITFKEYVDQGGGINGENYILPNADRKPKAGDEYVFVNIVMPESYNTAAQRELKAATVEHAAQKSVPQRSYSVLCDPRVFKIWKYSPAPGDGVRIVDTPSGVDYATRIIGVEYPVIAPDKVKLTLADKVPIPASVTMARSIKEVKSKMAMLDKNQITEERLRAIFHPLGGSGDLDFAARMLGVQTVNTKDAIFSESLRTVDFLAGLLGYGFMCDNKGNMEAESLTLRKFLMTPELIKNHIRVVAPEVWFTESGIIDTVIANPTFHFGLKDQSGKLITTQYNNCFYVTFRNPESEAQFAYDDILRGIYHYDGGFATAFLRVRTKIGDGWLLEKINGCDPAQNMVLARQGNYTNPARQGAVYVDSAQAYIRVLGGMNSTEIKRDNLMAQLGNLRGLAELGITDMPPVGLYTRAGVFKGLVPSDVGADPAGTAASALTAFEEALGKMAYKDAVELAQLGSTIISGGYIRTGLIDVDGLAANVAFVQKLVAQRAFIESLSAINANFTNIIVSGTSSFGGFKAFAQDAQEGMLWAKNGQWLGFGQAYNAEAGMRGAMITAVIPKSQPEQLAMEVYGNINIPGILAAGSVNGIYASLDNNWSSRGCLCGRYNHEKGKYKITHWIGHTKYSISANIVSTGFNGGVTVLEKTPIYIVVGVHGLDNEFYDQDFDFTICGDNRA